MLSLSTSTNAFNRTPASEAIAYTQPFILPRRDAVETFPWEGLYIITDN